MVLGHRYEVLDKLDSGTLADIRSARDLVLDRTVSIKLSEASEPPWTPALFSREARLAAALQHPHLLPVYDYFAEGGGHYLVMRTFETTLRQHLEARAPLRRLSLQETVSLFRQLATATDYLHQAGMLHGNLKPDTVVLDSTSGEDVHAFIFDFGLAAIGAQGVGTPLYMAPEQFGGHKILPAVDVFALGVMLYECMTGESPFKGETLPELLWERLHPAEGLYSACLRVPELPIGVDVVIAGFTQVTPENRYQSASAGIDELARVFYEGESKVEGTTFVSYARSDGAYVADLCRRLRALGIKLWTDQDIAAGANWDRTVQAALKHADRMLLLLSPAAVASENVGAEWNYFLEAGKSICPFVIEPCELPFRLRLNQHSVASGDLLVDVGRIVRSLAAGLKCT